MEYNIERKGREREQRKSRVRMECKEESGVRNQIEKDEIETEVTNKEKDYEQKWKEKAGEKQRESGNSDSSEKLKREGERIWSRSRETMRKQIVKIKRESEEKDKERKQLTKIYSERRQRKK